VISFHQVVTFGLAAFIIIIIPGPSVLFVVSRGVALGRAAAIATVVGNTLGAGTQGVFVALGLGALVTRSIAVYTVVKFGGAIYLVYLGWSSFRHRKQLATNQAAAVEPKSVKRIIREGFTVGVSNPKVIVFFSATLPQFVNRNAGSVSLQMLSLLGVFCLIGLVCDSVWGMVAGSVRQWFVGSSARLERLVGAGGIAIMGLGVRLALSRRND
jgi:threonine/homoserine/homoserine lactone efflux protein